MPKVYLIEGPVGAGKSTFAKTLALRTNGIHIALDEWFVKLYSPDRPSANFIVWYVERKERLLEMIWSQSHSILASGTDAILELGLVQQQGRIAFCQKAIDDGAELKVYVLDAPKQVRLERVRRRNTEKGPTFSMVVSEQVFEMASNLWEAPDEVESRDFDVEFISTMQADANDTLQSDRPGR